MKLGKIIFSSLLLLVSIVVFNGCQIQSNVVKAANAYITLDINPSIEIITDEEGLVAQVNALNEDAQVLLVDTDFTKKTIEETVEEIINLATELGYIDITAENAIVVTTLAENDNITNKLEEKINDIIRKVTKKQEIKMDIINARHEAKQEMKDLAASLNVSIGKLKLIQVAVELDPSLTLEQAATMPVKDLNKIVKDVRNEMKDIIKDKEKASFIELKTRMYYSIQLSKVQFVYNSILEASDDIFTEILEGTTVTVEELKTTFKNYYDELVALEDTYNEEEIEGAINEDAEVLGLLAQKAELEANLAALVKPEMGKGKSNGKENSEYRKQFNEIRRNIKTIEAELNEKVKELMITLTSNEKIQYRMLIEDNKILINIDYRNEFHKVMEKYQAIFLEVGIDLEGLEALFIANIKDKIDQVKDKFQDQIDGIRENAKNKKDELKDQLKKNNQEFKNIWKIIKNNHR